MKALSIAPAAASLRPPARRRRRIGQRPVPPLPTLWAVVCCVCETIGPISTSKTRGTNPTTRSGWRYLRVNQVAGWWCRGCLATRRRILPPATRAHCIDGPRPCERILCRYHMLDLISRKAPDDFTLPESCALDVVDRNPEGMTLREIGLLGGMTREGIREIEVLALPKLRAIPGLDLPFEDIDAED